MNSWHYNRKPLEEVPQGAEAFVYMITVDGKYYIGKKSFYKSIKRPPLKGYKRHRRDKIESNWKKYCSSSSAVKDLVDQGYEPERDIIRLCSSQKEATFWENKMLFNEIHDENCLNENISGKFFKEECIRWNQ